MAEPVLVVDGLTLSFPGPSGVVVALRALHLEVPAGQTLGLVGESGSGKSVTALSVLRLLEATARIEAGEVRFAGEDVLTLSPARLTALRGAKVGMIFQEPMTSLNPVQRVGDQVIEALMTHLDLDAEEAEAKMIGLFHEVGLPDPERRHRLYPHELSGGQKQRVMIAMALSCDPSLLLCDEPTTALDVTTQAQILELIRRLQRDRNMAVLFITHDLGVLAQVAHEVAVLYRGQLVERGPLHQVLRQPQHPYTQGLLACRPPLGPPPQRLPTLDDFLDVRVSEGGLLQVLPRTPDPERRARWGTEIRPRPPAPPLLQVRDLVVHYVTERTFWGRPKAVERAVNGVEFQVPRGRTLGLVGESGSGKTTTGKAVLRLIEPDAGEISFDGVDVRRLDRAGLRRLRKRAQFIFQDPSASLNPRLTIGQALTEVMEAHQLHSPGTRREVAAGLLREVGLLPEHLDRFPHEFSGGQRQRVCIARALAVEPELLVCDESVSALDVSVQAVVLNLLKDLQDSRGLSYLFISHDLAVIRFLADEVCVMHRGRIVERGPAEQLFEDPRMDYTRQLLAAIPRLDGPMWGSP